MTNFETEASDVSESISSTCLIFVAFLTDSWATEDSGQNQLERRLQASVNSYYRSGGDSKNSDFPREAMALDLFQQGVTYYKSSEYELAQKSLKENTIYHLYI